MTMLADGTTTILFRITEGSTTRPGSRAGDLSVLGPRTRAHLKVARSIPLAVTIRFKPAGLQTFLGYATSELTDRFVSLADVWGREADDLLDQLLAAKEVPEMLNRLQDALIERARRAIEPAGTTLARRAVRRMKQHAVTSIEQVALELGVSARHLRRAFRDSVGVSPRNFLRMQRVERAIQAAAESSDWAKVAVGAGYYDQSHMITDFQQLVGLTPCAFVNGVARKVC